MVSVPRKWSSWCLLSCIVATVCTIAALTARPASAQKCFTPWQEVGAVSDDGEYVVLLRGDGTSHTCNFEMVASTGPVEPTDWWEATILSAVDDREPCDGHHYGDCGDDCHLEALESVLAERERPADELSFTSLDDLRRYGPYDLSGHGERPATYHGKPEPFEKNPETVEGSELRLEYSHFGAVPQCRPPAVIELDDEVQRLAERSETPVAANVYVADSFVLTVVLRELEGTGGCDELQRKPVYTQVRYRNPPED